ncbi:MAG: sulfite exporter TauE/SafE family protein [Clostridia bacterium]|nr:sulfite exporter TauE/SafE family protein [Clostridia bacterium]
MEPIIVVAALIMFIAATVQGIAGFGRALIAAPLIALFTPADETVVVMITLGFIGAMVMVIKNHRNIHIKRMIPMVVFGVIGSIAGVQVLSILPVKELKITMGAFIIVSAVILSTGFRIKIKNEKVAYSIAGLLGGFTNGAISFGGPPTVLFLQNQNEEKNVFRANLSIFFLVIGFVGSLNLFLNGMLTGNLAINAGILAVPTILGTFFGHFLSHKFHEDIFRKIVLVILFAAGAMAIVMSLV